MDDFISVSFLIGFDFFTSKINITYQILFKQKHQLMRIL
jgi:hypothetical protein